MSYKRTMRGVDYLIENELDFAADEHGATFASLHEGAAVLCEEVDEVALEYHDMGTNLRYAVVIRQRRRRTDRKRTRRGYCIIRRTTRL